MTDSSENQKKIENRPQHVTVHGRDEVVVSAEEFRRLKENQKIENRVVRCVAFLLAGSVAVIGAIVFGAAILNVFFNLPERGEILKDHFGAIIGMPVAAAIAFLLVVFLQQTEGPIEFEGLGFKFNAASGQVAMWVVCFLAIAGAIKLLWW